MSDRATDILIKAEGLGKKFTKDFSTSLRYGLADVLRSSVGLDTPDALRKDEFWALQEVSFEVRRGECLGLIGHNGAGKSTLLKLLNGIIKPDLGHIEMRGRVGALIELGAGFNPILTGRENIYNNGSVLGFSKKEIDEKFEDIVAFSELDEFIDMPVQNYSSGMKVRLGFAVASNLEPDVLLIDEVLAVGDIGFKIKCYNKIIELLKNCAIVFVSHSMPQVSKICSEIMLLDSGQISFHGRDVVKGVEAYYNLFPGEEKKSFGDRVEVMDLRINGQCALEDTIECSHGDPLRLDIDYRVEVDFPEMRLGIQFFDKDLKPVATVHSHIFKSSKEQTNTISVTLPVNQFSIGKFTIGMSFMQFDANGIMTEIIKRYMGISTFKMAGVSVFSPATFQLIGDWTTHDSTTGAPTD